MNEHSNERYLAEIEKLRRDIHSSDAALAEVASLASPEGLRAMQIVREVLVEKALTRGYNATEH